MSFATVRLFVGTTFGLRIASLRRKRVIGEAGWLNRGSVVAAFLFALCCGGGQLGTGHMGLLQMIDNN